MNTQKEKSYGIWLREQISILEAQRLSINEKIDEHASALEKYEEYERSINGDPEPNQKPKRHINIPLIYEPHISQEEKVLFALNNIKKGNVQDVAIELLKLEPSLGGEKSVDIARKKLSILKLNELINYETINGNKNGTYYIKEKNEHQLDAH